MQINNMSKFDQVIRNYVVTEQGVEGMPPLDAAPGAEAPPADPAAGTDATVPQDPGSATDIMTPEAKIQMLDMIRQALAIDPTQLSMSEKGIFETPVTGGPEGNVKEIEEKIDSIFARHVYSADTPAAEM